MKPGLGIRALRFVALGATFWASSAVADESLPPPEAETTHTQEINDPAPVARDNLPFKMK